MSAACTAWFYSPTKDRVTGLNVINKIVAGLDPPFCHVELQFPNGEACSIVMNGLVTLRKRPFDLDFYTAVAVRADVSAVEAAHALARKHVQARTSFGVMGNRTVCSKLVLDLLCNSGMLANETNGSRMLTPSALFRILQKRHCMTQSNTRQMAIGFVQPVREVEQSPSQVPVGFKQKQKENVPEETQRLLGS
jgi:hypothetical protein